MPVPVDLGHVCGEAASRLAVVVGVAPRVVLDRDADFGRVGAVRVGVGAQLLPVILPETRILEIWQILKMDETDRSYF